MVKRWATRKEKGKAIMKEEGTSTRNQVPSAEARVRVTSKNSTEVLTVSLDIEEQ